ncbi:MAG: hypothetical protein IPM64_11145 [Phycisphaerales bacterium]|nr:hypothetical protein [Phycisphaerales bacterium]
MSARLIPALLMAAVLTGCAPATVSVDDSVAAYVRLMMPRELRIQPYSFTRPISFANDGNPDALEVVVAAFDQLEDPVKVFGTFHFELYERRPASSDPFGERIGFWPVTIDSHATLARFRDRSSPFFFCFPLKLENPPLRPGTYILNVRLMAPGGETLFDEYRLEFKGGRVPPPRPR